MSLENDIKQDRFIDSYHKLILNVLYTASWVSYEQSILLKSYDLTLPQYNVLRILRGQYPSPVRINDIIERMLDKTSNASRLVDKLLLKQLAERTICPLDRRAVDVVITQKGLEILAELDEKQLNWHDANNNLSEEEATLMSNLLDKMRHSI